MSSRHQPYVYDSPGEYHVPIYMAGSYEQVAKAKAQAEFEEYLGTLTWAGDECAHDTIATTPYAENPAESTADAVADTWKWNPDTEQWDVGNES